MLPNHFQGELNQARGPRRGDTPKVGARAGIPVGLLELRMVPGVEELSTKLQPYGLFQTGQLPNSHIPVVDARSV